MSLGDKFPSIDPGEFRHHFTFLNQIPASDASGTSVSWSAASPPETAWGKMQMVRGTDVIKSGQDTAQVFMMLTTWYRSGSYSNKRIQTPNGSQFVIQAVENVLQMNAFMVLTCIGIGANE